MANPQNAKGHRPQRAPFNPIPISGHHAVIQSFFT
jgi:hypothetical protein